MYLNDIERFTKLLQDKKRDKILQMMDDMHKQNRRTDKKAAEVKEFINTLKKAGKQRSSTLIRRGRPTSSSKERLRERSKEKKVKSPDKKKKYREDKGPTPYEVENSDSGRSHRISTNRSKSVPTSPLGSKSQTPNITSPGLCA